MRIFLLLGLLSLFFAGLSLIPTHPIIAQGRIVRVVNATAVAGSTVNVAVELVAQGNENGLGFSLTFNSAILSNPQITMGSGAAGVTMNVNISQAAQGRVGIVMALPSGQSFPAGTRQLLVIAFTVAGNAPQAATIIGFGDQPVGREVADAAANVLATTFTSGTVTVQPACSTITISPATLPGGQLGQAYNQQLTQTGGAGTITWSINAGSLPTGVSLNASTGLLSGTPTAQSTYNFTVTATDGNNCTGTRAYQVVIGCPAITITPATLNTGTVNIAYNQSLTASAGTPPYTFSLNPGSTLPPNLSITGNAITGTPASAGSFSFTIRVTDASACTGTQSYSLTINPAATLNGLQFYPLSRPLRLLDTRPANERPGTAFDTPGAKLIGQISGGTPRRQLARVSFEGQTIPATATTIVGTATVINFPGPGQYNGTGNVSLYPSDSNQPDVSNLNYTGNQTIGNGFTVGLSGDGRFDIFLSSDLHLVIDIAGYYAPPGQGGLLFHPLSRPVRLLETRANTDFTGCYTPRAPLAAGSVRVQQATGGCAGLNIPATAKVIVGNITAVNPSVANGAATAYASDLATTPNATSLNYFSGQAVANAFTTRLSNDGKFSIFVSGTTDMLVDVTGYYSADQFDENGPGLVYTQLKNPVRLLDTRSNLAFDACYTPRTPLAALGTREQPALVCKGTPIIPPIASVIVGNATVINFPAPGEYDGTGNVTLYPSSDGRPEVSNANYAANQIIPNAFAVGLAGGSFNIFSFSKVDFLVDITGYFAP